MKQLSALFLSNSCGNPTNQCEPFTHHPSVPLYLKIECEKDLKEENYSTKAMEFDNRVEHFSRTKTVLNCPLTYCCKKQSSKANFFSCKSLALNISTFKYVEYIEMWFVQTTQLKWGQTSGNSKTLNLYWKSVYLAVCFKAYSKITSLGSFAA